jgi:TonB family protein
MKQPSGYARPKRLAAPKKKVRLNLRRAAEPELPSELNVRQKSNFWPWVVWVTLFHVIVIGLLCWYYQSAPAPKPYESVISLLPPGDVVKGSPGAQQAHKLGVHRTAASIPHTSPPPAPARIVPPKPATPPPVAIHPPKPVESKPAPQRQIVRDDALTPLAVKPVTPPKPKAPKIKVDLTKLEDGPATAASKPAKPKPHPKKVAVKTDDDDLDHEPALRADSALTREQIAERLGEKLDAAGVKDALKTGPSGSINTHANAFSDFYDSIRDQAMNLWKNPDLSDDKALDPVVHIHVEKDGRVPPESVRLLQSSGDPAYDDSAVEAAKSLGYLHEPLPDGCPPDISITFKPNR